MSSTTFSVTDDDDNIGPIISFAAACTLLGMTIEELEAEMLRSTDLYARGGKDDQVWLPLHAIVARMAILAKAECKRRIERFKEAAKQGEKPVHYSIAARAVGMKPYVVRNLCRKGLIQFDLGNTKKNPRNRIFLVRVSTLEMHLAAQAITRMSDRDAYAHARMLLPPQLRPPLPPPRR